MKAMIDSKEPLRSSRRRFVMTAMALAGAAPFARAAARQSVPFSEGDEPRSVWRRERPRPAFISLPSRSIACRDIHRALHGGPCHKRFQHA